MLITKYVPDAFYASTLKGGFKIGTLAEYRATESAKQTRLSDDKEGIFERVVAHDIINQDLDLGSLRLRGVTITGGTRGSIGFADGWDGWVFCSSMGPYDRSHHEAMLRNGNEDLRNYVTIDVAKFKQSMHRISSFLKDAYPGIDIGSSVFALLPIKYLDEKTIFQTIKDIQISTRRPISRARYIDNTLYATFVKPSTFQYEREFRVALIPGDLGGDSLSAFYIKDFGSEIMNAFADTIVSSGVI